MDGAGRARPLSRLGLVGGSALLGGCAWDGPQSTLVARSDFAREILHVYGIITGVAIVIAAVVTVALAWVLLRFREPAGGGAAAVSGHALLEISWTIARAIVLLIIAVPTIAVVFRTQAAPPRGALEVVVRVRARLRAEFGPGRWRKLKGTATVRLRDGTTWRAELHWYEAHGVWRRKLKIKGFLE